MQPAAGMLVNERVRLVRPLGAGGMGSVWVAEHLTLETEVAVKFITLALLEQNPELVARFKREASAAAKIQSPHVVQTFDRGVTAEGLPYIVMELLRGESLRARLTRKRVLAPVEVAVIVRQTARALDAAHALGIVHRDIKPDNLFMCSSAGELLVKVLDFGIAKQRDELEVATVTRTGTTVGTPQYMSPEQLLSGKNIDAFVDLWALAVVAYEALTGRHAFEGETLAAMAIEITSARFVRPSRMPGSTATPALDTWFERAFEREKARRFASALELARAFEDAVAGAAGAALVAPPVTPVDNPGLATGALFPELTAAGDEQRAAPQTVMAAPAALEIVQDAAEPRAGEPATELRAPALESRAPATELRAPALELRAPATELRAPATELLAPEATHPRGPALGASDGKRPGRSAVLVIGGVVALGTIGAAWFATRGDSSATASSDASASAGTGAVANPGASTGATASAMSPAVPRAPFSQATVPAGPARTGSWMAGYAIAAAPVDVGLTLHEAYLRCAAHGRTPCSDEQWQRACALHPELGGFESWTATSTTTAGTYVVRGGGDQGCTARATADANTAAPARGVACCERAIAVGTDAADHAFAEAVAQKVLAYEHAVNDKRAEVVRATLGARVRYNDKDWTREALVKAGQNHFSGDPSQWTFYDTCNAVDAGKRWKVDCNVSWRRSGKYSVLTQELVFEGDERLLVSLVEASDAPRTKEAEPLAPSAGAL